MVQSGGIKRGRQAARVLESFFEQQRASGQNKSDVIPATYWSVRPVASGAQSDEQLLFTGAVLLRVRGRRTASASDDGPLLSPELVAALNEPPSRPGLELLRLLSADRLLTPALLLIALALTTVVVMIEVLLFRVLFELNSSLALVEQRVGAMVAVLCLVVVLLLLEWPLAAGLLRSGRHLEGRLRLAFLRKIPRLGDQYFRSRLTSDMAERSHAIHIIRTLPEIGGRLIKAVFEITLTTAGIIWLLPASGALVGAATAIAIGLPLMAQPLLSHLDVQVRTHSGPLSRFYLDALLGLVPVRAHGPERAIIREHESLLVEWSRACLNLHRPAVVLEGLQSLIAFGFVACLLYSHDMRGGEAGTILLLVYWALNIPVLGQELVIIGRQYPMLRNVTLRLLEPLGAREELEDTSLVHTHVPQSSAAGVAINLKNVSVHTGGHSILKDIDLDIEAGSHVAVVGVSGAGKSSLVGLLLGWHRAATGSVLVDDCILDQLQIERLRRVRAWVDPEVQLWNESLLRNLSYGTRQFNTPLDSVIEESNLRSVLERLPQGLQMSLGEGGALLSGGERRVEV